MAATVVIPARLASTRFPEKVLAADTGRPLVQHVVDQVRQCRQVSEIIVAADDARIVEALRPFETACMLTRADHATGTDRLAEVAERIDADLIINVQGDEPEIAPDLVDQLTVAMQQSPAEMGTVAVPFPADCDVNDPNMVKVVVSADNHALYFSRCPVPYDRDGAGVARFLHVGVYAYRKQFLLRFAGWRPTPLEQAERLEQLRALEHGAMIKVVMAEHAGGGIDTPQQYARFVERYRARTGASGNEKRISTGTSMSDAPDNAGEMPK